MELPVLITLVEKIHGATFATLDALTSPKTGLMCRITGERVILFRTNGASGYENMVKKHLEAAGKNPDSFRVGSLPWGERMGDLPIITHNDRYYLQTIQLAPGTVEHFLKASGKAVDPSEFGIRERKPQANLPPSAQVLVNTYNIDNIERITLMGETLSNMSTADNQERPILSIVRSE